MPLTPFLDGHEFDPETKRRMGVAFEMARVALEQQRGDRADIILAGRIIALAKAGEPNLDALCEQSLNRRRRLRGGRLPAEGTKGGRHADQAVP